MNKILIIGGAGFIGVNLTKKLLREEKKITIIDRLQPENPFTNVNYIKSDIRDYEDLDYQVSKTDIVFNLASQLGIKSGIDKPVDQLENNLDSCRQVIQSCSKYQKRLIHASSSAIYGKEQSIELDENSSMRFDNFNTGSWNYALSKLVQETMIVAYAKQYQLPFQIIRFFNCIGIQQKPDLGHVVPNFIKAALDNHPLIIHGSGDQERTFIHIDDAIQATILIMNNPVTKDNIHNIGGQRSVSIEELANIIIKLSGSSSSIKFTNKNEVFGTNHCEPTRRIPCIKKIRALGYIENYPFPNSISEIIDSYQYSKEIL